MEGGRKTLNMLEASLNSKPPGAGARGVGVAVC